MSYLLLSRFLFRILRVYRGGADSCQFWGRRRSDSLQGMATDSKALAESPEGESGSRA
jgi:hypothetical protein